MKIMDPLPGEAHDLLANLSELLNPTNDPEGIKVVAVVLGKIEGQFGVCRIELNPSMFEDHEDAELQAYSMIAKTALSGIEQAKGAKEHLNGNSTVH